MTSFSASVYGYNSDKLRRPVYAKEATLDAYRSAP